GAPRSPGSSPASPPRPTPCSESKSRCRSRACRRTCFCHAAPGATRRPTMHRPTGSRRCSGTTSPSSRTRCTPRSGTRGHGDRVAAEAAIVTRFEVVRDPLWDNIRLDPEALAVVDTPAVQRLRYVRQLGQRLVELGIPAQRLLPLIQCRAREPLAGLVSGSLDVDKLDYLSRDAWMCGVPYGVIDVDRLLTSLTLAPGADGHPTLALHEKGLAALESLLFAKYQMYRNVYWHHAVRSATSMFKRLVRRAIAAGRVQPDAVAVATDDGLIHELLQQ